MAQESPPLEQPGGQSREHQLRFIVNVLVRRWRMIGTFAIGACLVYGSVGLFEREKMAVGTYQAQAKVLVRQSFPASSPLVDTKRSAASTRPTCKPMSRVRSTPVHPAGIVTRRARMSPPAGNRAT